MTTNCLLTYAETEQLIFLDATAARGGRPVQEIFSTPLITGPVVLASAGGLPESYARATNLDTPGAYYGIGLVPLNYAMIPLVEEASLVFSRAGYSVQETSAYALVIPTTFKQSATKQLACSLGAVTPGWTVPPLASPRDPANPSDLRPAGVQRPLTTIVDITDDIHDLYANLYEQNAILGSPDILPGLLLAADGYFAIRIRLRQEASLPYIGWRVTDDL